MAAALAAADGGASVMLIDDQPSLGGHLRYNSQVVPGPAGGESRSAAEAARSMADAVSNSPNVEVLNDATVFGLYQDRLVAVLTGEGVVRVRAKQVVLATGAQETPLLFENNDLPGIMLSSSARRLIALYGIRPGRRAVIATETNNVTRQPWNCLMPACRWRLWLTPPALLPARLQRRCEREASRCCRGIRSSRPWVAGGSGGMVAPVDGEGRASARRIRCDLLCMSGEAQPVDALLHQMGASQPGVTLAGQVGGATDLAEIVSQGREAGRWAAAAPSSESEAPGKLKVSLSHPCGTVRLPSGGGERTYVCFCEDVSAHDIDMAIDEGFADVQILKRYTTVTMGPCQERCAAGHWQECASPQWVE